MKKQQHPTSKAVPVEGRHLRARKVQFPVIVSKGPKVAVTNERIYRYIVFP